MAVYRWIYANAKMESDRKDYYVRVCDRELEGYRGMLIELSNRLLSADRRRKEAERQKSWFSGYLDEKVYLVAAGGDQRDLLGIEPEGYRPQHCVLAYGLTKDDIRLYQKKDEMFEPLKKIMREIQEKGRDSVPSREESVSGTQLLKYVQTSFEGTEKPEYNIIKSTAGVDERLWKQSLDYPVMTGIISAEDGKKLLEYFPDGIVTVLEEVRFRYRTKSGDKPQKVKKTADQAKENKQNTELERLKKEQEEKQKKLEVIRLGRRRKERQVRMAAVLILLLLFFAMFFWFLR